MIHWQASISLSTLANMPALEGHLKSLSTAAPVNDEPQNRIFLWTAPRCISTAFERSVMEVGGGKLFHEPYTSSYYFGPERISRRYEDQEPDMNESYRAVTERLTASFPDKDHVFVKDMAYAVHGRHHMFQEVPGLSGYQHTFLIRHPAKAVASLYKASRNTTLTGWTYFDEAEAGFQDLYDLHQAVSREGRCSPVVVDCDDVLAQPEEMMQAYCRAVGLKYKEGMSSWEPGKGHPDWNVWEGWHNGALQSSGFQKKASAEPTHAPHDVLASLPPEVADLVDRMMPLYQELRSARLMP